MTNNKVAVSKEVAEAIETLRSSVGGHNLNEYGIITYLDNDAQRRAYPELNVLYSYYLSGSANGYPVDLMKALVNGYEVEKSPEEKAREYYADIKRLADKARAEGEHEAESELLSEMFGVVTVLNKLGIKIEGVNA